ncbi:MAG: 2-amino-4-hydroxy-6-hydroxymethyldihydropteridine diphosphokinase [Methylococcaceae bacterium]
MIEVYIGLGSNLENPAEQVKQARLSIAHHGLLTEVAFSSLYASPPMGPQDQPDYVNAVMCVNTELPAIELLRVLQKIEHDFGRVRKGERWGARTLDLDLLLYGDQQIEHPDLLVPHIGLTERAFVLYPLQEIAPGALVVPGKGAIKHLLSLCPLNGLEKLD